MFITYGSRRINTASIKTYAPLIEDTQHSILFEYIDGTKEKLHFFAKDKEMKAMMNKLDQNLLAADE